MCLCVRVRVCVCVCLYLLRIATLVYTLDYNVSLIYKQKHKEQSYSPFFKGKLCTLLFFWRIYRTPNLILFAKLGRSIHD